MKHLKLFEEYIGQTIYGNVDYQDVWEMTLEMSDVGFEVTLEQSLDEKWLLISIDKNKTQFCFNDIKDDILRIINYTVGNGGSCEIKSEVYHNVMNSRFENVENEEDIDKLNIDYIYSVNLFVNNYRHEDVGYDSTGKYFTKTKPFIKESLSDLLVTTGSIDFMDVKDMTLEIEDSGLTVKTDPRPKDRWMVIEISHTFTTNGYHKSESFNFSSIKDDIIRIVEYADRNGGNCTIVISPEPKHNFEEIIPREEFYNIKNEEDVNNIPYEVIHSLIIIVNNWSKNLPRLQESLKVNNKTDIHKEYSDLINWEMISDAKDMALEYIDTDLTLMISIRGTNKDVYPGNNSFTICEIYYNHEKNVEYWYNQPQMHNRLNGIDVYIHYELNLSKDINNLVNTQLHFSDRNMINELLLELIDRVKRAYPNLHIRAW